MVSILHYNYVKHHNYSYGRFSKEGNIEFLRRGTGFTKIQDTTLTEIKRHLTERGLNCRPAA